MLNNTCLNFLRKIITFIDDEHLESKVLKLPEEAIVVDKSNEDQTNAINQLKKIKLIQMQSDGNYVEPKKLIQAFKYYAIVKYFDHTTVFTD